MSITISKPSKVFDNYQNQLSFLLYNLEQKISYKTNSYCNKVKYLNQLLNSYDYNNVLKRGYSLVRDKKGNIINKIYQIEFNQTMNIEMSDGKIDLIVKKDAS